MSEIRVGIVGLGANTRARHLPGLRACPGVRIQGVCNRRAESTSAAALEFDIPRSYAGWQDMIADDDLDAIVIGTWPYLHCDITVAALDAGKHVLCEARMARNLEEATAMRDASDRNPTRVAQLVPSPFGLRAHTTVMRLIGEGLLGDLREYCVTGTNDSLASSDIPLHWRQNAHFSGLNMLALGILHETLIRWIPEPETVFAQVHSFTPRRHDPTADQTVEVGTPDSVQVLTTHPRGARGIYRLSGAVHHGPAPQIQLYGSLGTLSYVFAPRDQLFAARREVPELQEVSFPADEEGGWRVEEDFIRSIREQAPVQFTDFSAGVRYMAFTQAVSDSGRTGSPVTVATGI